VPAEQLRHVLSLTSNDRIEAPRRDAWNGFSSATGFNLAARVAGRAIFYDVLQPL